MNRRDLVVFSAWAAAVAALAAPAWAVGSAFFNHGDLYTYHAPLRHLTAASLQEGRLPFWNPFVLGGVPHLANPQTAVFYPATMLSALFPVIPALTFDQLGHLLWAGLGAFLLARRGGLERGGALALASAYALSPFLVYRVTAGIPTLLAALAWVPWVWLAWLGGGTALLAGAWALQLLSGHGQFLVVNAAGMGLWALTRPERAVLLRRALAGGAAALALTAPQWLPTAEFLRLSNRGEWGAALAASYSLEPRHALAWLLPGVHGTPLDGGWGDAASVFYESAGAYAGLAGLLLAAAALPRLRSLGGLALAAAGGFLALGGHNPLLAPWLGAFPYLRTPSRWSFLVLWGVFLLAGAGARASLSARPAWQRGALALVALLELLRWDASFLRPQDAARFLAPRTEMAEQFAGRPMRVLVDPAAANLNKTVYYRARGINGYDAFYPAGRAAFAARVQGEPAADTSRVLISRWPSPLLRREGAAVHLRSDGRLDYDTRPWPLAAFIGVSGEPVGAPPRVLEASPGRWRLAGARPAGAVALRVSEPSYPGWRAALDGAPPPAPARPDGELAQVFALPASAAVRFELDFVASGWPALALLGACAWAAWLGLALRAAEAAA
ncbi:MAG: hypothetical protein SF051_13030 [Elusimicrobiota bacterium]|nr:hypothetical protein [Elusimicrobiota bacterium]